MRELPASRTESPEVSKPESRATSAGSETATSERVLALQRTAGNRATVALVARGSTELSPLDVQRLFDPTKDEPRLQGVAKDHANRVIDSVKPIEAVITSELTTIAAANGGKLEGLDHRLKTPESLQRKLADLARTRVKGSSESIEDAVAAEAANTKDALRYTITVPPDAYAELADTKLRDALAAKGATRIKASNAWADPEGSYHGFNSAYEIDTPSGGARVKFEVQIHTPESWEMKSELHQQYEDARKEIRMSNAAKAWLNNYMKARWKTVKVPKGMEAYDDKMNKRP